MRGTRGWIRETSPHTRGKRLIAEVLANRIGNIPAYAGKTAVHPRTQPARWKHPRIRGETRAGGFLSTRRTETSPHTRGKLARFIAHACPLRNIPAYAGKTYVFGFVNVRAEKHPRIRGENTHRASPAVMTPETSPHTRGKPYFDKLLERSDRNIPAYAGKTFAKTIDVLGHHHKAPQPE